ncbi:MAG: DUF1501 domain-containing protein [Planctomycetes bacterium]|nr:DUF1501 domain-containing protein [Planctomycetota bacterium]
MLDRRGFLGTSIAGLGVLGLASRARAQEGSASSTPPASSGDPSRRILVVVQLSGGNDGLNTVVPYADDAYQKARPKLAYGAKDVLRIDDGTGLHPSMKALHARYGLGQVAIVQAVGYARPNRSHFRSMAIWHSADTEDGAPRTGWFGRTADALDAQGADPAIAVSLASPTPFALQRASAPVLSFDNEEGFTLQPDKRFTQGKKAQVEAFRKLCAPVAESATYADRVRATAASGIGSADKLLDCLHAGKNRSNYPRGAGTKLAQVARLIDGGQATRLYYVTTGGYDTHARQKDAHAGLLASLSDGIEAFFDDLEASGRAQDVVLVTFSEFGRRLAENGSQGTDHGTCGPMFVVGPGVKGGLVGEAPDLAALVDQDPVARIDFRSVYASVVQSWLGLDATPITGAGRPLLPLFA